MRRQESLGSRLKKLFPNTGIKVEYFALHYRTDFTIEENKLVVEIDEKYHDERDTGHERRRQKELEKLDYYFIRINPDNQILMNMKNLVGYKSTSKNQLKNY